MAKVRGPAFSLSASGPIGPLLSFVQIKRATTARRPVAGKDAASPAQLARRAHHRAGHLAWRELSVEDRADWDRLAIKSRQSGYTLFLSGWLRQAPAQTGTRWDAGATRWDAGATRWDVTP